MVGWLDRGPPGHICRKIQRYGSSAEAETANNPAQDIKTKSVECFKLADMLRNHILRIAGAALSVSISISLISWSALALDVTVGDLTTCTKWLEERAKEKSWLQSPGPKKGEMPTGTYLPSVWILGFLQGRDWSCLNRPRVASGLDTGAVFERIDNICRSSPEGANLHLAVEDLIEELDPLHAVGCDTPGLKVMQKYLKDHPSGK